MIFCCVNSSLNPVKDWPGIRKDNHNNRVKNVADAWNSNWKKVMLLVPVHLDAQT